MIPIITAENLVRHYQMGDVTVKALRGVDFFINKGEMVAILGPSGSGKSTLMHLIGCLDTPTDGNLKIDGEDVSSFNEKKLAGIRNRKIGFIFQQFNLLPRLNVLENVMTPLMYARIPVKDRKVRAEEAIERVGLSDRITHRPYELSGGQKQRVAIARALVTEPTLILADEPTGSLDSETGHSILTLFKELHDEGNTIIMVTHDPEIGSMCRRKIHLFDGRIVAA
ncbi:MAG: ABC transporter ATP-binding protein [Spirochaetales bacterium]|nr:ABC transporter ATP-binding protein [Spirochaetales bacterium]